MNKRILPLLLLVTMMPACVSYVSSIPTANNVNGDAWYTTRKMFKSKVWYCPAPSNGPATCTEAKLVPQGKKK
ncbi:MAG: hypothetical protein JNL82_07400 [Myxococcales bacterium]|nr:hypothetical protein [Myxococcales bacterium]